MGGVICFEFDFNYDCKGLVILCFHSILSQAINLKPDYN